MPFGEAVAVLFQGVLSTDGPSHGRWNGEQRRYGVDNGNGCLAEAADRRIRVRLLEIRIEET
ncbi:hypothetical protein FB566_3238 [Stackebrandtia endophytica]|uniref:Uncharacterized protein n=1 Tax=Stackebrandtia endophytica TaxID=1496996 RepID=A0A543AYM7_9ACTN|nr:hypothetical protein FB566_3238 [Stackebrandtia endophytica]